MADVLAHDPDIAPIPCTHSHPVERPPPISHSVVTAEDVERAERWYQLLTKRARSTSIAKFRRCTITCVHNGQWYWWTLKLAYEKRKRVDMGEPEHPDPVEELLYAATLDGARRGFAPLCQALARSGNHQRYHLAQSNEMPELWVVLLNDGMYPSEGPHNLPPLEDRNSIWALSDPDLETYEREYELVGEFSICRDESWTQSKRGGGGCT